MHSALEHILCRIQFLQNPWSPFNVLLDHVALLANGRRLFGTRVQPNVETPIFSADPWRWLSELGAVCLDDTRGEITWDVQCACSTGDGWWSRLDYGPIERDHHEVHAGVLRKKIQGSAAVSHVTVIIECA